MMTFGALHPQETVLQTAAIEVIVKFLLYGGTPGSVLQDLEHIRGGTAQAYSVGVESSMPAVLDMGPPVYALCVAPFGMEEGSEEELPPQEFGLIVGEPVSFRFFGSSVRRHDQVGTLLDYWDEEYIQEMKVIEATLPAEGRIWVKWCQ